MTADDRATPPASAPLSGAGEDIVLTKPEDGSIPEFVGAHRLGRYRAAIVAAFRYLKTQPNEEQAWWVLIDSLIRENECDRALETCATALRVLPQNPGLMMLRARALTGLGRMDEAEASYRSCLQIHPEDHEARHGLATLLADSNRRDEAIATLTDTADTSPLAAFLHWQAGVYLMNTGDHDWAARQFRRAVALSPLYVPAYVGLVNSLPKSSDLQTRTRLYGRISRLRARSPEPRVFWANALAESGDDDQAIRQARIAVALKPQLADSYFALARCLTNMAQPGQAATARARAEHLDPAHPIIRHGRRIDEKAWERAQHDWFMTD